MSIVRGKSPVWLAGLLCAAGLLIGCGEAGQDGSAMSAGPASATDATDTPSDVATDPGAGATPAEPSG